MPFPITVNPQAKVAELGFYGPFEHNGNLYLLNYATDGDTFLVLLRSTDSGSTWLELDSGAHPSISGDYTCCQSSQDTSQLYCLYVSPGDSETKVQVFNLGTGQWSTILGSSATIFAALACYRAVDNSIVIIGGDQVTLDGFDHAIPAYAVFDIAGQTFSALTPMDYLDYLDPTLWDQGVVGAVCDSAGVVRVISLQATRTSNQTVQSFQYTGNDTFVAPADCVQIDNLECWGAGGGGGNGGGGGGGGGGYNTAVSVPITPGQSYAVVVGAGGAAEVAGGDTSFDGGTVGGGGDAGSSPGAGGSGGTGLFAGGAGGAGLAALTGGGGGGSADSEGAGQPGQPGGAFSGGFGGTSGAPGNRGAGGTGGALSGIKPGSGGINGSGGGGGVDDGDGGIGGEGLVTFTYVPFSNSHPSRLWQQSIRANDTLTVLTEIPEGETPINSGPSVQFDIKATTGRVLIALSGVTGTDNTSILVGEANNADTLVFAFESITVPNGGSNLFPSPALAINNATGEVHCLYIVALTTLDVQWFYRSRLGGVFGAAIVIGSFANAGCRIQAAVVASLLSLTFGTPTNSSGGIGGEGGTIEIVSFILGNGANLIQVVLTTVESGPALNVIVTPSPVGQYSILLECGVTEGGLIAGSMANLAVLINASIASSLIHASGLGSGPVTGDFVLAGGTSGAGVSG